jgi:hypothetical protein
VYDECIGLYQLVLTDHADMDAHWTQAVRAAQDRVAEELDRAYASWNDHAARMQSVRRYWDTLPPHLDARLGEVERCYRSFTSACRLAHAFSDAATKACLGISLTLRQRLADTERPADQVQANLRRLRLPNAHPPVIGWDEHGMPRFNDPRILRPSYDGVGAPAPRDQARESRRRRPSTFPVAARPS